METSVKKKKRKLKKGAKLALAAVLICVVGVLIMSLSKNENKSDSDSSISKDDPIVQDESISFPVVVDDGKVEIENLFQYTGYNPDCRNEDGSDIAGVQIKNISEQHLAELTLTLILEDETELQFAAYEIPAGKSAAVFSLNNTSIKQDVKVKEVKCESSYLEADSGDLLQISTDGGVQIILTNTQDTELTDVTVYCHNILDDYFGGIAYQYTVDSIPAKESAVIEAWDCFLGIAEVARIEINKGE